MKIAIVHDFLCQYGGAEKVVEVLHEMYPTATIFTSIYVPEKMPQNFREMPIKTSFMQFFPGIKNHFKKYFLIYPFAFYFFDFSGYDLILSSSSSYSKGIRKPEKAVHVCYCYTPPRFIWRFDQYFEKESLGRLEKGIIKFFVQIIKRWDLYSARRVDYFIAISHVIRDRIKEFYNRESVVIYPPVETHKFCMTSNVGKFYLVVSRLNAYKRVDIVIHAFNHLGLPLRIIGDGSHMSELKKMANSNIEFLGRCSNNAVIENVLNCRAFIFPGEEDFGIAPVEAQSAGHPVIAFAAGGALETVLDGVTGQFFKHQTVESLLSAIDLVEKKINSYDCVKIRENALRFDRSVFQRNISLYIDNIFKKLKGSESFNHKELNCVVTS